MDGICQSGPGIEREAGARYIIIKSQLARIPRYLGSRCGEHDEGVLSLETD